MNLDYIRNVRGLDFVEKGMRILFTYNNKWGTIVSGNAEGNLNVMFDNEKRTCNVHPTWMIQYYKNNELIKEFKE